MPSITQVVCLGQTAICDLRARRGSRSRAATKPPKVTLSFVSPSQIHAPPARSRSQSQPTQRKRNHHHTASALQPPALHQPLSQQRDPASGARRYVHIVSNQRTVSYRTASLFLAQPSNDSLPASTPICSTLASCVCMSPAVERPPAPCTAQIIRPCPRPRPRPAPPLLKSSCPAQRRGAAVHHRERWTNMHAQLAAHCTSPPCV